MWLKIQHVRAYNFEINGSNLMKLYQARGRCDNVGTTLGRVAPTKFGIATTSKIRRNFW